MTSRTVVARHKSLSTTSLAGQDTPLINAPCEVEPSKPGSADQLELWLKKRLTSGGYQNLTATTSLGLVTLMSLLLPSSTQSQANLHAVMNLMLFCLHTINCFLSIRMELTQEMISCYFNLNCIYEQMNNVCVDVIAWF